MRKLKNKYLVNYLNIRILSFLTFLIFLLNINISSVTGQKSKEEIPPLSERIFFGGSFGLQFGTLTNIQVAPVIGLWLLPRLAVAGGPDFTYYKFYDDRTTMYGGKLYSQFVLVQDLNNVVPLGIHTGLFLQLEDELMSLESSYWKVPPYASERFTINTLMAGGGISQQIGQRSSMNITFLWALTDSGYSIYGDPEIRLSFNF